MRLRFHSRLAGGAAPLVAALLLAAGPAAAKVDRAELADRVAEAFGAEVMRIESGTLNGEPVLYVTMMRRGGNDNAAFKVDTLPFHAETGEPLRGQMPQRAGSENLPSMRTGQSEKRPDVLRGRPWR